MKLSGVQKTVLSTSIAKALGDARLQFGETRRQVDNAIEVAQSDKIEKFDYIIVCGAPLPPFNFDDCKKLSLRKLMIDLGMDGGRFKV